MKRVITEVIFPDIKFLNALTAMGAASFDVYNKITLIEPKNIRELDLNNCSIEDLTGIEYFPNLRILYVSNNKLEKINLKENPRLEILHISKNKLRQLDVSNLRKLKELIIDHNKIEKLILPNSKSLFHLDIRFNKLKSISLDSYQNLRVFLTARNQIQKLDFTNNRLHYLVVDKSLKDKIAFKSGRGPLVSITDVNSNNWENWLMFTLGQHLVKYSISSKGNNLKYMLRWFDPKRLYHRYKKDELIISKPVIYSTGLIFNDEYLLSESEMNGAKTSDDSRFSTELSILDFQEEGFPKFITAMNGRQRKIKFQIKEIYFFLYKDFPMSELIGVSYTEVTKKINKKIFYILNT